MFMKNFLSEKIYLTLVIIQKIQGFLMRLIKKLLVRCKMNLVELLLNLLNSVVILTPFAALYSLPSIFFIEYIFDFNPTKIKDTYWQLHSLNRCCPASN